MWRSIPILFFLSVSFLIEVSADEAVQSGKPAGRSEKAIDLRRIDGTKLRIDGRLDEAVWKELPFYDEFVVIEPDTLAKTAYSTRVRIFYDESGIYFGIDMDQPPETLVGRLSGRDSGSLNRDSINITLDTSGNGRYGYWFGLNLGNSLSDGTLLPEKRFSSEWDGVWRASSRKTEGGWSGEFHIPWSTLSMPEEEGGRRLGLFMSRKVAYLDERWGWPALPFTVPKFISALKSLRLDGINPKQQYSFSPFATAAYDKTNQETRFRSGLDFFWRPSTDFQMTGTLNPDFGSVESDDVVINLSATETFFPEKRLFFLEGQDIFVASPRANIRRFNSFANEGAPTTLVNTRRIGGKPVEPDLVDGMSLSEAELRNPVELLGALKVTGQTGKFRYGVMGAFEDDFSFLASRNEEIIEVNGSPSDYGIARVLYEENDQGAYKAFGFLTTAVLNQSGDVFTHGADAHYLSGNGKLKVDGQVFMSDLQSQEKGYGGFVDFEYTFRQGIKQRLGIEYQDEEVDLNGLGFLERNDNFRVRTAHTRLNPDPWWARDNYFDLRGYVQRNKAGLFTGSGIFLVNRMTFNNLSKFTFRAGFSPSTYDDLNSFGNGAFRVHKSYFSGILWETDSSRKIGFALGAGYSREDLGGHSHTIRAKLNWRPKDQFSLGAGLRYMNRWGWLLHQESRNFATFDSEQWQPQISADYFITARQHLRLSFQWVGIKATEENYYEVPLSPGFLTRLPDRDGKPGSFSLSQMSLQIRYRWEIAPLSDLFLVYTRLADEAGPVESFADIFSDGYRRPFENIFVAKLRYRFGS